MFQHPIVSSIYRKIKEQQAARYLTQEIFSCCSSHLRLEIGFIVIALDLNFIFLSTFGQSYPPIPFSFSFSHLDFIQIPDKFLKVCICFLEHDCRWHIRHSVLNWTIRDDFPDNPHFPSMVCFDFKKIKNNTKWTADRLEKRNSK